MAHNDPVRHVLNLLVKVKQTASHQWEAKCPAHDDKRSSLSISRGTDGRALLHCHAGCELDEVLRKLHLERNDLFVSKPKAPAPRKPGDKKYERIYDYEDEDGRVFYQVCRAKGKKFSQRCFVDGQWYYKDITSVCTPVLYRLPSVLRAVKKGRFIFLVEGEKDAEAIEDWSLVGTCCPKGSKSWHERYVPTLQSAHVVILRDNDEPGRKFGLQVAHSLVGVASSTRIIDLPGLPIKGDFYDWKAQGHTRDELIALVKQTPKWTPPWSPDLEIKVQLGTSSSGDIPDEYTFGERCFLRTEKKRNGEMVFVNIPIAKQIWPMQRYISPEDRESGYRFAYINESGQQLWGTMPGGAAVSKREGGKYCRELRNRGVQIATGSEHALAFALGHWAERLEPPVVTLVRSSGWHSDTAYVNGHQIFGAPSWFVDEQSAGIADRQGRKGTLEGWRQGVERLALQSKGLLAAIAQSLAGALIEPLQLDPYILHLWVDSTQGKSTAARLAASIWGSPDQTFKSWNTTRQSPEALAEQFNGACLVLDDTARVDFDPARFAQVVHALCSPIGRSSLGQGRSLNEQRRWRCTILSTGEISIRQKLGEHYQGGHRVRALDLFCTHGNLARDDRHAEELRDFCHAEYGVVGDAWIEYLLRPGVLGQIKVNYRFWREKTIALAGQGSEEGRIAAQLAVIAVALQHATSAGLLDVSHDQIYELLGWIVQGVLSDANASQNWLPSTPNERAYQLLMDWFMGQPFRFPESTKRHGARDVVAYSVSTQQTIERPETTIALYTTEGMISASGLPALAAVSPRRWLRWCVEQGLATRNKSTIPGGLHNRWVVFQMDSSVFPDTSDTSHIKVSTEKHNENGDSDT